MGGRGQITDPSLERLFIILERFKEAIQVCYELTDKNKDMEINGLIETMDEFKLNDGLIITGDLEEEEIKDGKKIEYKPLWKWLLE